MLPPLLPFLDPGRCFRTWDLTIYQFFYPSLSFRLLPKRAYPSFNFQKACWDGFSSYFDSHCSSAEEHSSLSSAAALFISLALNAAKSSIPFGRIKRPPKAWWSAEMKSAVSERRKAFAAAHRNDENRLRLTSPLLDTPCQSSPKPRLRYGRRFALLFHLNLTLNLITLFFAPSLAHLPPLLTSPTVLLTSNRLRSSPLTKHPTFPFPSKRPCVAEPEATSLSSVEPRALTSLALPSALFSPLLNFLWLTSTSPHPLPLAQTKLPIPC